MRTTFLAASSWLFDDAARQGIVGHKRCLTTTADPLHCLRDGDYDGKLARQKHRAPNNGGGSPWYSCLPRSAWMRRKWLNYSRHTAENSGKGAGIQGCQQRGRWRIKRNEDVAFLKLSRSTAVLWGCGERDFRFPPPNIWWFLLWDLKFYNAPSRP